MPANPSLVAVGGGTSSGKTTLCRQLLQRLGSELMCLIHLDSYFRTDSPTHNEPRAIDEAALHKDLDKLSQGVSVTRETPRRSLVYAPKPLVVIEGHLALTFPRLVSRLDLSIYVDLDPEERLLRRITRNVGAGDNLDEVIAWYRKDAKAGHWRFIEPSKRAADVIIWGDITPRRVDVVTNLLRDLVQRTAPTNPDRRCMQ